MQYRQGYQPPSPAPKKRPRSRGPLFTALLVILLGGIVAGAILITGNIQRQNREHQALVDAVTAYDGVYAPNITVDGISLSGMTAQEGIDAVVNQISARQGSWQLNLNYQGHTFYTLTYDSLGVTTDLNEVYELLRGAYQKGKVGTLAERKAELDDLAAHPYAAATTQSEMTDALLDSVLSQIRDQLTWAPMDAYLAYFDPDQDDPFVIQSERYGSTLDISSVKAEILALAAAGRGGNYEIVPTQVAPAVTTADVRSQVTLLCRAVTPISSASTEYRTSNIRTAFSRINGLTLESGKSFSFNRITLDRTAKNGYLPAIEYGEGGLEKVGIGGGVCQASTTVYLAALQSGMQITERSPHADQVSYTTFGQDATVVYGRLDLKFKNTSSGTVYLTAKVEPRGKSLYQCVVCIYGPSLGDGVSYKLRTAEQVETIPAPLSVSYVKDTDHAYVTYTDQEPYLYREARDGFINETYLQLRQNGQVVSETLVSRDTCKPRETVYLVGTQSR